MTLREKLKGVSAALARIPSIAYFLLYLISIPGFALLYTALATDFYHTTIQYEASLHGDADRLLQELRQLVHDKFIEAHKGEVVSRDGWQLDFSSVSLHSLRIESDEISFGMAAEFLTQGDHHIQTYQQLRVSLPIQISFAQFRTGAKEWTDIRVVKLQNHHPFPVIAGLSPVPTSVLFPYREEGFSAELLFMPTPRSLSTRLIDFARAMRGFPSGASGQYWRMLYLSAVTITTVGYGDIVPLTTRARLITALEAVFGVILIGLFLNALAHENATHNPQIADDQKH